MNIGFYYPSNNVEHQAVLASFQEGVERHGDVVRPVLLERFDGTSYYDAAVVYGVGKRAVAYSRFREAVRCGYHHRGKRVVVLEKGYVNRHDYYAVGWDALNGRADFASDGAPGDRWDQLGVALRDYELVPNGYVLVVGQVPWDASVESRNHIKWLQETVATLRQNTARDVFYRPHPLSAGAVPHIEGAVTVDGSLEATLQGAYAVVTQSSNVGVDATIAGRPAWASDEGSMVWGIANKDLRLIETPTVVDRGQWANEIAYCQWTVDEMAAGLPWARLRPHVSKPVRRGGCVHGAPDTEPSAGLAPNLLH